jgi:hypothetical protein
MCVTFVVCTIRTLHWFYCIPVTPGVQPFLRSRQLCSFSRASWHFMEPEGSLPCSQEPSTGPYPEPEQSNPSHPISLRSILILFIHLHRGLPSGLFPSGFRTNIVYAFVFAPLLLHALPISLSLIWSLIMLGEDYKLWSSSLCSFLQSSVTLSLFGPNILKHP